MEEHSIQKAYGYLVGLENIVHQCWRITPNWKCHLTCNFCYVPQLLHYRKRKYGVASSSTLDLNAYQNTLHKMLKYYRHRNKEVVPQLPLSFCASDPPRDLDLQLELLQVTREEYMKVFDITAEVAEREFLPTTIILDIHDKGAKERCLELMDRVTEIWKYGFIWIASTLWVLDGELKSKEVERHLEFHEEALKRGLAFFSIITPSATSDTSPSSESYINCLDSAKLAFEVISHSHQYMATINVTVPVIEGWKGYDFKYLRRGRGRTFVNFYHAYCLVNTVAFCNKFGIEIPKSIKKIVGNTDLEFHENSHYVACEYGILPGLNKTNVGDKSMTFYSNGFGCFPTIGCFTGILGIEPSGYLSACQFGHDELSIKAQDLEDYEKELIYSPQRIRNIRAKVAYPFYEKFCEYRNTECTKTSCSDFSRGSCPVDLYFNDRSFLKPSYVCSLLSEATDRQLNVIQEVHMNPVKFAKLACSASKKDFHSLIVPELEKRRRQL